MKMSDLIDPTDSSTTRRKVMTFQRLLLGSVLAVTVGWAPRAPAQCNWTAGTGKITETCGTVGVGTTTPTSPLHVAKTSQSQVRVESTGSGATDTGIDFADPGHRWVLGINVYNLGAGKFMLFDATTALARLTVDASGKVGIGTTDPTEGGKVGAKLTIRQNDNDTGLAVMNASGERRFALNINASGSWTLFDGAGGGGAAWTAGITQTSGKVGIGTTAPLVSLHVAAQAAVPLAYFDNYGATNPHLAFRFARGTLAAPSAVQAGDYLGSISGRGFGTTAFSAGRGRIDFIAAENWSDSAQGAILAFNTTAKQSAVLTERMRIDSTGSVGIGTTTPDPAYLLHVAGAVRVDGNIAAKYQDLAEWVPGHGILRSGTVVVLDQERSNEVLPSQDPYDTRVAGVISDAPGIILGEAGEGKVKVATTGRVKVRVDATHQPVRVGDLLVTSPSEGVAMRSEPIEVAGTRIHRPGTIIGKALEPLTEGKGEILVLLSLQ